MTAEVQAPISTRELVSPRYTFGRDALEGIERLVAIEEIRATKACYSNAVDDHDWQVLRTVFTDDCEMDWCPPGGTVNGPDDFVGFLELVMTPAIKTVHHVHNLVVEFVSPEEAHVRWDHENWTWFTDGSGSPLHQLGQYREKYRKTPRGWLISYFSELDLFNARAPQRRAAGLGDPSVD